MIVCALSAALFSACAAAGVPGETTASPTMTTEAEAAATQAGQATEPVGTPTPLPIPTVGPQARPFDPPPGLLAFTSVYDGRRDVWLVRTNGNGLAEVRDAGGVNETQPAVSPDGETIYYVSDEEGTRAVWAMDADGTHARKLIEVEGEAMDGAYDPAVSPDGTRLAIVIEQGGNADLWLLPLDGSAPVPLTDTPEQESAPTWLADGRTLLFARADEAGQNLYTLSLELWEQGDPGAEAAATSGLARAAHPQINAAGTLIVFEGQAGSAPQIMALDTATGAIEALTETGYNTRPALSPDGRLVTFVHEADFQRDLMTLNLETGEMLRLIDDFLGDDSPSYAPNGWQIVFASQRKSSEHWGIYLMNAEGAGLVNATADLPASIFAEAPEWSPDGQWLAFDANFGGDRDIYIMPVGGTAADAVLLVDRPGDDCYPSWSPDGTQIVFMGEAEGDREIFVINIDGTGLTRLTHEPLEDYEPDWSPDGTQIVFTSRRASNSDIYVMDADGSNVRVVSRGYGLDWRPQWSPDGEWIAFESYRDGNGEIYIVRPNGTDLTRLTDNDDEDGHPTWSPDGTKIAFHSNRGGWYELYVMEVANPENVILVQTQSLRNLLPVWRPGE